MTETLDPDMQNAVDMFSHFLSNPDITEMGIIGPPGSGKSWLVKYLVNFTKQRQTLLNHLTNQNISTDFEITATTNEAANVLGEFCGVIGKTIHHLLGLKLKDNWSDGTTSLVKTSDYYMPYGTVIVIDEAGTANKELIDWVRRSVNHCKILYVGDPKQLVSIGSEESYVFNTLDYIAELEGNRRNNGPIGDFAKKYRDSVGTDSMPPLVEIPGYVEFIDGDRFQELIKEHYLGENAQKKNHAKIVAWRNATVNEYNGHVRSLSTEYMEYQPGELVVAGKPIMFQGVPAYSTDATFRIKELVEQGDVMGVECYTAITEHGVQLTIPYNYKAVTRLLSSLYQQGKECGNYFDYFSAKDLFCDIRSGYAGTTHKAQGRTNSVTFIDLDDIGDCYDMLTVQRLMTVATSRPTDKLYLYGDLPVRYGGTRKY